MELFAAPMPAMHQSWPGSSALHQKILRCPRRDPFPRAGARIMGNFEGEQWPEAGGACDEERPRAHQPEVQFPANRC